MTNDRLVSDHVFDLDYFGPLSIRGGEFYAKVYLTLSKTGVEVIGFGLSTRFLPIIIRGKG